MKLLRLIAIMFAGLAPAWAVDVDLPVFESNKFCPYFTGATNASPIRMTCGVAHHLTDNDKVRIEGVYGNTAANGTFYVDVITSTTFDLYSASGPTTAVAGNGTWSFGDASYYGGIQFASKVTPYALKAHPRIGIDPDGNLIKLAASVGNGLLTSIVDSSKTAEATYTRAHGLVVGNKICVYSASDKDLNCANEKDYDTITAVPSSTKIQWTSSSVTDATYNNSDLTVSAWAQGGNPYWPQVNSGKAGAITASALPLSNYPMNIAFNLAIICYVNRADTAACAAAKLHMLRPEVMGTNFGCDTSAGYCYDGKTDYIGGYLQHYAHAYSLMEWQLSSPEKDTIAEKLFNDTADGCTPLTRVTMTGTMSAPFPSGSFGAATSTLTGIGTQFLTELQVGSAIVPVNGTYFAQDGSVGYTYVTAIADDTHATITGHCVTASWLSGCGSITATTRAAIAPWSSGKCGALWYTKHHGGTPFGQPILYPKGGGTTQYGVSSMNNMVLNRESGLIHAAAALADTSALARKVFTAYAGLFANATWPMIQGWWSAMDSQGSSYSYTRGRQEIVGLASLFKYAFTSGPDLTTDPLFNEEASLQRFIQDPNYDSSHRTAAWAWGADGDRGMLNIAQLYPYSWAANISMNPTDSEVAKTAHWFRTYMPVGGSFYGGMMLYRTDPTVVASDYTSGPTQRMWAYPNRTACLANGYVNCGSVSHGGIGAVISRKSWTTTTDSVVGMEFGAFVSDHAIQRPGAYVINRGGTIVMSPDSVSGGGAAGVPAPSKSNELVPASLTQNDGEYAYIHGIQSMRPHYVIPERWRGGLASHEGNSDNKAAYWRLDLKGAWQSGVTTMTRDGLHLKASGKQEYFLLFDHVVTASGRRIDGYHHWKKNTGGLITCPSGDTTCTNINTDRQIDANAASSTFPISTKIIAPTSSDIFLDVGGSFPTGYTGGNGSTARLDICAGSGSCSTSATSLEYAMVTKFGTSVSATALNPDSNFFGVELTDWTVLKARGTSTYTACPSVTSTATTNYMCIGLSAGTYEVRLGGTPVSGCTSVPVVAGDTTILCENVGAGAITVVQTGAPADLK